MEYQSVPYSQNSADEPHSGGKESIPQLYILLLRLTLILYSKFKPLS